jgi:hypothetical protein
MDSDLTSLNEILKEISTANTKKPRKPRTKKTEDVAESAESTPVSVKPRPRQRKPRVAPTVITDTPAETPMESAETPIESADTPMESTETPIESTETPAETPMESTEPPATEKKKRKPRKKQVTELSGVAAIEAAETELAGLTMNPTEKKSRKPRKKEGESSAAVPTEIIGVGATETKQKEYEEISLMPHQVDHFQRIKDIMQKFNFAQDLSMAGAGKTYTSAKLSLDPDMKFKHVIVVCPVSVQYKWLEMKERFGINIIEIISFCSVRSTKCKQPKHGFLFRRDYRNTTLDEDTGRTITMDHVEFHPTEPYLKLVADGLLLIIDEIQNIKNVSAQFSSCQALIRPIINMKTQSRVLLLSGSPIDKKDQVVTMLRGVHIMKSDRLSGYDPQRRACKWEGMNHIQNFVIEHCPDGDYEFRRIVRKSLKLRNYDDYRYHTAKSGDLKPAVYKIYQTMLKPLIASSMPPPVFGSSLRKYNYICNMFDKTEGDLLIRAVTILRNVTGGDMRRARINTIDELTAVTQALTMIETAKIGTFIRLTREIMEKYPTRKVVLCVNYTATIKDLATNLREYDPIILNGSLNMIERGEAIRKFQTQSTENRILICNVFVASTGIDLDDKNGDYPRTAIVSPNYSTITLYQLAHRFKRADTKSNAEIVFCFCKPAIELPILNSLAKKSEVMKDTTKEQADAGVEFPGDYDTVFEEGEGTYTDIIPGGNVLLDR